MKKKIFFLLPVFSLIFFVSALQAFCLIEGQDSLRYEDKIRIREAMNIFNEKGKSIWREWENGSFVILLISNDTEFLMNCNSRPNDFALAGYDSILQSSIYSRPRQLNKNLLATFPAVNGIPVIVVGLPENTSRKGVDWVITILHEHFHQYQSGKKDHYESIDALGLSGGDNTGMWMLNYNFPYTDKSMNDQYKKLIESAKQTLLSNSSSLTDNFQKYFSERNKFREMLNDKDYKYFSFQIWQEGLAKYTEIKFAELIKDDYTPSEEFIKLNDPDASSLDSFYLKSFDKLMKNADEQTLSEDQRECFYTLGAIEGLILDKLNPDWKDLYFTKKFFIENYFNLQ